MGVNQRLKEALPDIVEVATAEEACDVDKSVYRLERFSETRQRYIFVKRTRV